ncbi:MAG: SDR family oxidoreductase, partial [Alphaproteobacteria bacterium]|nr:SDR family oxidoreductase [Alphaproteobacteria bacterium]
MADYAIVTGGSQGIGLAICRRLKRDGLVPVIFDRVAPEDSGLGEFHAVDLSDIGETRAALDWALALGPVSRLVNNVGVVMPALLEDTSLEDFDTLMALNVRCAIQCTQAVAPGMRERQIGRIVNIASMLGLSGGVFPNAAYQSSKGAVVNLTRTLAVEWAPHGITVNAVGPALIRTDLTANIQPEFVAALDAITPLG